MGVKYVKDFEFPQDGGFHVQRYAKGGHVQKYADGGKSKYVPLSQRTDAESRARALAMSRAMSDKARAPGSAQQKAVDAARARLDASRAAKSGSGMSAQVIIPGTKNGVPGYYTDASRKNFVPTQEQGPIGRRVIPGKPLADFAKRSAQRVSAKYASNPPDSAPEKFVPPVPLAKGGKVEKVMREYKEGKLHSGSKKGPVVKNRKQAIAIALAEARKAGEKVSKKAEGGYEEAPPEMKSESFKEAFRRARNAGQKEFSWRGDRYTTKLKEEVKLREEAKERVAGEPGSKGGPSSRKGPRRMAEEKSDKAERPRYSGVYGETQDALSMLSPEQKKEALKTGVMGALSMIPAARAARGAALMGRTGEVNVRGMTLAQRERDAAAAANYADRMKKMKETAQARSRMSKGAAYAEGGAVSAYGDKKGPYRGSPKKARELGRQDRRDRRAREVMERAEKYAPGLSLDMKAKGGVAKHKDVKMDKAMMSKAVHKHEKAMHPGKPLTKLRHGGVPSYGRKPMYGGGKC
jgi:hypothetical protein